MVSENIHKHRRLPKVAVLMATYNGAPWVVEQMLSILNQQNVDITLYVSDDCSTDSTWQILNSQAAIDQRILILPRKTKFGTAGKNFYRLIRDIDINDYDFVAFSDQDDIWLPTKLRSHADLIQKLNVEAISSNVTAFWENGRTKLIKKSQPPKSLDYLFEAAGPGCTYLMTPKLFNRIKLLLNSTSVSAIEVSLHDWLSYAVCRCNGWGWHIDENPSVLYRQHSSNVLGANSGVKPKLERIRKLNDGWYRSEVFKITDICLNIRESSEIRYIHSALLKPTYFNRLKILRYIFEARRKLLDRLVLLISILLNIF